MDRVNQVQADNNLNVLNREVTEKISEIRKANDRHIELEASEVVANGVNFMLQFRNDTLQAILTSEYGLDPVYKYLYGEALHIRVRSCSASFAYYNNPDFLCYDSCPDRTYPVEPDSDISKFYC